jgi:hypothetical protein
LTESPHGTDDPREIVDDLDTRARAEATPDDPDTSEPSEKEGEDVADEVPGSPEPPD